MPTSIQASGIVNMTYFFDNDGNLNYRQDNLTNQKEMFGYDGMNRLTNWNIYQNNVLVKPNSIVYNATTGTITSKSDLGNFIMNYGENGKPHALTSIEGVPANFPTDSLNVTYSDFKKIKTLTEGNKYYILTYGIDDQRRKSEYKINGITQKTKYYLGDYEEETDNLGNIKKIHYLSGGAILVNTNGVETLYYGYSDYQGNLIALSNDAGTVVENGRFAYDPWGKRRNPADWTQDDTRTSWIIDRGYTMHEHLSPFGGAGGGCIINMNGRVYDPLTAMFFSPDPFVQAPGNWLNFNRYSYAYGNPFKYVDPDGEFIITTIIIVGAIIGGYTGYKIAEAKGYDLDDWQTWGLMLGGAVIGGGASYLGAGVAAGGGFFANTAGIMAGSVTNSMGMAALSGGMLQPSISFGPASYNFGTGEWGYLGKEGNKWYEDLSYGLGALANVSDILAGFKPGEIQIQTENTSTAEAIDKIGHTQVLDMDGNSLIDFGPGKAGEFYQFKQGRNNWISYASNGAISQTKNIPGNLYTQGISIKGVNASRIASISNNLNTNPGFYNFALRSCSSVAARALTASGVPVFGIHPYLLQLQATLWNGGIRPWTFSYFFNQQY